MTIIIHIPTWISAVFMKNHILSYSAKISNFRNFSTFFRCQVDLYTDLHTHQYQVNDNYIKSHLNAFRTKNVRVLFWTIRREKKNARSVYMCVSYCHLSAIVSLESRFLVKRKLLTETKLWCYLIKKKKSERKKW